MATAEIAARAETQVWEYDPSHTSTQIRVFLLHNWRVDTDGEVCRPPRNGAFRRYVRAARADGRDAVVDRVLYDIRTSLLEAKRQREREAFLTP